VKMFSAVSSILVTQEMDSVFKTLSTDCRHWV
jgi:hypothetical protein